MSSMDALAENARHDLRSLSPSQQWLYFADQLMNASAAIRVDRPVLFICLDNTPGGGEHHVGAIYEPGIHQFTIGIPDEPAAVVAKDGQSYSRKGGRFPTVLHAIEIFTSAFKLAQSNLGDWADVSRNTAQKAHDSPYPHLEFLTTSHVDAKLEQAGNTLTVAKMPLTICPSTSNILIFNKTAHGRSLNQRAIAQAHYETVRAGAISDVMLRHTMLLEGKVEGGNKAFEIGVLPEDETRQYRLFRTARLDHDWAAPWRAAKHDRLVLTGDGYIRHRFILE